MLCALLRVLTSVASSDRGATCSDDDNVTATQPWGDGMLLVRSALLPRELSQLLAAERAAWADTSAPGLVNRTRRITGSAAVQSVTWLHRHRSFADGALERAEAAALAAQESAGWTRSLFGPLHVRCVESIRYSVVGADTEAESAATPGGSDEQGWHQDEWSVLTAVLTIGTSADLEGGEIEVDRGSGGPRRSQGLRAGDLLLFRSWDAPR